jgi:hypothetical protein
MTKVHRNFVSNDCGRVGTWIYDLEEATTPQGIRLGSTVPPEICCAAMEKKRENGISIAIMGKYQQGQHGG